MTYAQIIERAINNFDQILESLKIKGLSIEDNTPVEVYYEQIKKYLFQIEGLSSDDIDENTTIKNFKSKELQFNVKKENDKFYIELSNPGYYDSSTKIEILGVGNIDSDDYEYISIEPITLGFKTDEELDSMIEIEEDDDITNIESNSKILETENKIITNNVEISVGDWAVGREISKQMTKLLRRVNGTHTDVTN